MNLEVKLGDRLAKVELIEQKEKTILIKVDDKLYELDIQMVENGVYSVLYDNKSFNLEMIREKNPRNYVVNSLYNTYDLEIIDAQAKYLKSRSKGTLEGGNAISSPMPGKVVKIPVHVGDTLKEGDTAVIVEAMKMQSEYKVGKDCVVKKILVAEGDTIDGNQVLVEVE